MIVIIVIVDSPHSFSTSTSLKLFAKAALVQEQGRGPQQRYQPKQVPLPPFLLPFTKSSLYVSLPFPSLQLYCAFHYHSGKSIGSSISASLTQTIVEVDVTFASPGLILAGHKSIQLSRLQRTLSKCCRPSFDPNCS